MNYIKILNILFLLLIIYMGLGFVSTQLLGGPSPDALLGAGDYLVGEDIPAGEYYVKSTGFNMYVEDARDSSRNYDSIIFYVDTLGGSYITVQEGEHLIIEGGELYQLDRAPINKTENGYYKNGMFKVGTDIPAGEYVVESSGSGYVTVSVDSRHTYDGILSYENVESYEYVYVQEGQYLTLHGDVQIKA